MARGLQMPTAEEYRAHGPAPFGNVRAYPFEPESVDEQAHTVSGYVSTDQWARDGMRILPQAWAAKLDTYRKNPVVPFGHAWWEIPPGRADEIRVDSGGLWARLWFDVEDPLGAAIWQAIITKRLRCTSVGWPETPGSDYGEWKPEGFEWQRNITLMDISVVTIPSDTDATFALRRAMGLETRGQRGATAFADLPLAAEETAWDAGAAIARVKEWAGGDEIDWPKYRKGFLWYDASNAELQGSYKFPFADVIDGTLSAVWRALVAALGRLDQADIPDGDRDAVRAHIARYYEKFGKDMPERAAGRVAWRSGEPEVLAEIAALDDLARLTGGAEGIRNYQRHVAKCGGDLSPIVIERALRPLGALGEIAAAYLREGRVLSAANRKLVDEAVAALEALQAADDGSRKDKGDGATAADEGVRAPTAGRDPIADLYNADRRRVIEMNRALGVRA